MARTSTAAYKAHRVRQIAYGRWAPYMEAQPVREHVAGLMAYGLTREGVAQLAGVSRDAVAELMVGAQARGRGPSLRVLRVTADALLGARFDLDACPDTISINADGTVRRLQALAAIGYPVSHQAVRLGRVPTNLSRTFRSERVSVGFARQVRDLYNELSMRPVDDTPSAKKARTYARKYGWVPPLAWDDDLIDLPEAQLVEEISRRVALMDWAELARCDKARRAGDPSPVVLAASREYRRQAAAHRREAVA